MIDKGRCSALDKPLSVVSLFCGAGGLDIGLARAGFETIWANDINKDACASFSEWLDADVICASINDINATHIPQSDIIIGGFPCQGFSLAGPRKINDSRNKLYLAFVSIVRDKQPLAFIAENVCGLLSLDKGNIFKTITSEFETCGYCVVAQPCNAANFGVPQDRKRIFIIGIRKDIPFKFIFPQPDKKKPTLKNAIGDFGLCDNKDVYCGSFSSRYMSRNRKRKWNEQSYTIPAMAKQVPLHPSSPDMVKKDTDNWEFGDSGKTRRLSWQEAALIQTFPQEMNFVGNLTSKYQQIGNAVPPELARRVGLSLKSALG